MLLPKELVRLLPKHLMSEEEWRKLGVTQSRGWVHYMKHEPGWFYLFITKNMCYSCKFYPTLFV